MSETAFDIKYVRLSDMHDKSFTRDKLPMISVGALKPLQETIRTLQSERDAVLGALCSYYEYFEAIKRGEYSDNRRTAPLRTFEEVLQCRARETLAKIEKGGVGEGK